GLRLSMRWFDIIPSTWPRKDEVDRTIVKEELHADRESAVTPAPHLVRRMLLSSRVDGNRLRSAPMPAALACDSRSSTASGRNCTPTCKASSSMSKPGKCQSSVMPLAAVSRRLPLRPLHSHRERPGWHEILHHQSTIVDALEK